MKGNYEVNMSKPITYQDTLKSYYTSAQNLPSTASNYLNRQVETLRSYGNSANEFCTQTLSQLSSFAGRIAAFDDITDRAMLGLSRGMKKGALIGATIGLVSGGPLAALAGLSYGAQMGALLGFFKGFSDAFDAYDESVLAQKQ